MSRRGSDASSRPVSSRSKSVVHDPFCSSPTDSPSLALEDLLKPFIAIKPQFSLGGPAERPSILIPLMLLSRERLPLSNLDLSAPTGEFTPGPGRFFESHIRILDLAVRQGPSILIARSDATRHLYAIERHQTGLYVICKLGAWSNIEKLSRVCVACYAPRCQPVQTNGGANAAPSAESIRLPKVSKRKRLAIEEIQSMVRKRSRALSIALPDAQTTQCQPHADLATVDRSLTPTNSETQTALDAALPASNPTESQIDLADNNNDAQACAEDIFQNLRSQYFEALYHSKGSLAYFAKGPLSRARAAFHLDCDGNLEMDDLVCFLKGLVVAITQVDKKYKETIPNMTKDMKTLLDTDGEAETKPRRRKPKKMKIGKDGLYPGEVDHIKRWWRANKPELHDDESATTNPQETKFHVTCLRTRETQLQMIILLEVLALEAAQPMSNVQESQLPGMPAEHASRESTSDHVPRKQSKHNFPQLLSLHADRLCIWQDTTLEEMKMIAAESEAKHGEGSQKPNRTNSDALRDFCIDIVLPFFTARLPELSKELNKKLGGPVATSPPRSKKPSAFNEKAPAKPGSTLKRSVSGASGTRSLEKVFESDQQKWKASRKPVDVLARMRSATPASIPGLKREASEPLGLGNVPQSNTTLKERSRNVLSRSSSMTGLENTKALKQAKLEAELKEAISAIKKPNRHMAGKVIVEEAEKRAGSSSSPHPRKQKRPVRYAAAASRVQVKATPANFRFRDAIPADSRNYGSLNLPPPRTDSATIPSSSSMIPSTAPRGGFRDDLRDDLDAFHIASTPNKVLATPVAAPPSAAFTERQTMNDAFALPSSPIMSRKPAAAAAATSRNHLAVPGAVDIIGPSSPILPRLFETPIKERRVMHTTEEEDLTSTPPEPLNIESMNSRKAVVFETPAKRIFATSAPTRAPPAVSSTGQTRRGTNHTQSNSIENKPTDLTLNQQLGWDDYDFDDF